MKKNNKGFTLVELIATIVILSIVLSIGAYSIIKIIDKSSEKEYKLLIENINSAAELYYQECKYGGITDDTITGCNDLGSGITLGDLVENGYLTGNSKDDNNEYTLVNPNDGISISACIVKITYDSGNVKVNAVSPTGSCPTSY